jgi:hypothetical protein
MPYLDTKGNYVSDSPQPAPKPPVTPTPNAPTSNASIQQAINDAKKTFENIRSAAAPLITPVPAGSVKPVTAPTLPEPTAPGLQANYIGGVQQNLDTTRKAFEDSLKSQREQLEKQRKEYEASIAELNTKQEGVIQNNVQPLLQPFRENLEKTERERLKVEENFFENQKIVNEIQSLATTLQQDMAQVKDIAAPAHIQEGKTARIKEDSLARIGLLQAVVSIRNGQISTALNFIDRSTEAIVADRKDQLNYYQTLLNFYEGQKDEKGQRLVNVEKQDLDFVKAQVGLLESDLASAQKSFDNIKNMMTDPATADILARSGVKLTDTPEEVNTKLSDYSYTQESRELDQSMIKDGYEYILPSMTKGKAEARLLRIKDSRGIERVYYQKIPPKVTGSGTTVQDQENNAAVNVFGANIQAYIDGGATPEQALAETITDATNQGTTLDLRNQNALLERARKLYSEKQVAPPAPAAIPEAPKPGFLKSGGVVGVVDRFANAVTNYLFR